MSDDPEVSLAGNMGGVVRAGDTVRRNTGPWTPAVHALLDHLASRIRHVPRVLGIDDQGREVVSFLPGHVVNIETEFLSLARLVSVVRWTRVFHDAVAGFSHPGPWRFFPVTGPALIGHNDIAPYNVCFAGDDLAGVFDWDLSGPSTPLLELAFIAWNCVPLWRDIGPEAAARRLTVIAASYGAVAPGEILQTVPWRIQTMLDGIPAAAAAGDAGMARLMTAGEPGRSARSLASLIERMPAISLHLA